MPAWYLEATIPLERAGIRNYVPPGDFWVFEVMGTGLVTSSSRQRWIAMCTADNIKLAECLDRFTLQTHGLT